MIQAPFFIRTAFRTVCATNQNKTIVPECLLFVSKTMCLCKYERLCTMWVSHAINSCVARLVILIENNTNNNINKNAYPNYKLFVHTVWWRAGDVSLGQSIKLSKVQIISAITLYRTARALIELDFNWKQ